jgi:hypothetical protein
MIDRFAGRRQERFGKVSGKSGLSGFSGFRLKKEAGDQ